MKIKYKLAKKFFFLVSMVKKCNFNEIQGEVVIWRNCGNKDIDS